MLAKRLEILPLLVLVIGLSIGTVLIQKKDSQSINKKAACSPLGPQCISGWAYWCYSDSRDLEKGNHCCSCADPSQPCWNQCPTSCEACGSPNTLVCNSGHADWCNSSGCWERGTKTCGTGTCFPFSPTDTSCQDKNVYKPVSSSCGSGICQKTGESFGFAICRCSVPISPTPAPSTCESCSYPNQLFCNSGHADWCNSNGCWERGTKTCGINVCYPFLPSETSCQNKTTYINVGNSCQGAFGNCQKLSERNGFATCGCQINSDQYKSEVASRLHVPVQYLDAIWYIESKRGGNGYDCDCSSGSCGPMQIGQVAFNSVTSYGQIKSPYTGGSFDRCYLPDALDLAGRILKWKKYCTLDACNFDANNPSSGTVNIDEYYVAGRYNGANYCEPNDVSQCRWGPGYSYCNAVQSLIADPSGNSLPRPSASQTDPYCQNINLIATTPTPTPTPITLSPVADSYVYKSYPSSNYGSSSTLRVDGSPVQIAYMRFDLSSLAGKSIISAKLRFYITDTSYSTQYIKRVLNTPWSETDITYSNRPTLGTTVTSFPGGSSGTWKEIDITSVVKEKLGQLFSLAIDSTGSDGLIFYSRNSSSNRPYLRIY